MAQIFGTNPSAQALIEHDAYKESSEAKRYREESKKNAKAVHGTHKEAIKKLMGHITQQVENHGKDGNDVSWGQVNSLHTVHKHLLDIHKYLSPNKYDNDSAIVPAISPVRSY